MGIRGIQAKDGSQVRLETIKMGGTSCTSLEALQRFFDRLQGEQSAATSASVAAHPLGPTSMTPRQRSHNREAEIRAAERRLRMSGLDGDASIFRKSRISQEVLCDLHEFLHGWMPEPSAKRSKTFLAIRSGIFVHAVEILEGKHGRERSLEAAKQWIRRLDLTKFDVQQLQGVGPKSSAEWTAMLETSAIQSMITAQRQKGAGISQSEAR